MEEGRLGRSALLEENFIERRSNPEEVGGAGSFNNVISPKDLEFLRRIGNKLMQLSLIEGGRDWTKGVGGRLQLSSADPSRPPQPTLWALVTRPRTIWSFLYSLSALRLSSWFREFFNCRKRPLVSVHDGGTLINISSIRLAQLTCFSLGFPSFFFIVRSQLESCVRQVAF